MTSKNKKLSSRSTQKADFDAQAFLETAGVAKRVQEFHKAEVVYAQGDAATNVIYLRKGVIRLSVVSEEGKEAVVATLGPGDFFGEGCLAGQSVRMGTATAKKSPGPRVATTA